MGHEQGFEVDQRTLALLAMAAPLGAYTASDQLAQAYARQSHLDEQLDRYQRRLFTDWQREQIGRLALPFRLLVDHRIEFVWRIP